MNESAGVTATGESTPSGARLVRPHARFRASFCAALLECHQEGRHEELDEVLLDDPHEFDRYVAALLDDERSPGSVARYVATLAGGQPSHVPDGYVPQTFLWWIEGDEYLGRVTLRHRLTVHLVYEGGHVGYEVRPSARGQGHATAMLGAALPLLARLGVERALIDCDPANLASRRVVEKNGGELDGEYDDELYFWVPTAPRTGGA